MIGRHPLLEGVGPRSTRKNGRICRHHTQSPSAAPIAPESLAVGLANLFKALGRAARREKKYGVLIFFFGYPSGLVHVVQYSEMTVDLQLQLYRY